MRKSKIPEYLWYVALIIISLLLLVTTNHIMNIDKNKNTKTIHQKPEDLDYYHNRTNETK